ncbi:unnamed protein product [Porites lobata]|uniref:Uncharacterized protein n=1 Tax=Porites lobata TaxID=104759 RepID=A0ABN8QMN2_9CNID|nr:unnamed protein product [Porites lobata]
MVLNLVQLGESLVFKTGQDVMAGNGVVLFGMSPENPYFKSHVIEDYVQYLGKDERRIIVVVPQQPAEHTYRALGSKDAVKRAKKNSSQLKSHCRRAIDKVSKTDDVPGEFYMLDWTSEVDKHEVYIAALDYIISFYKSNSYFRQDVARSTAKVLGKDSTSSESESESSDSELEDNESVQEGVYYLLKELAFIISSKEMFRTESVAVIYHRSWPVYEKFVNGDYDGKPKEGLGLAIINYDLV